MRNDFDASERELEDDGDYDSDGLRWMSVVVVLLVVFGFISLAWYAYRSGVTSTADGDVPTLEAEAGPLKVAPTNPGGMDFPNQDKTVYETMAKSETGAKTEHLMEAPEEPILNVVPVTNAKPDKETETYRKPTTPAPQSSREDDEEHEEKVVDDMPSSITEEPEIKQQDEAKQATPANVPATSNTVEETKNSTANVDNKADDKKATVVATTTKEEAEPLATSPQQPAPPIVNDISAAAKAARDAEKAKSGIKDVQKPEATASKTPTEPVSTGSGAGVQLAASKSSADAEKLWGKLAAKYPDLLGKQSHAIVTAEVPDKGTFYRIRATGLTIEAAKALCQKLKGRGQDCMVVK